jgi:predicted nucleotidyltransferase
LNRIARTFSASLRVTSARNVRVFGSVVDLLVEMGKERYLLDLVGLEQDLEELLRRKVDVLTDEGIHPAIRQHITAEARTL